MRRLTGARNLPAAITAVKHVTQGREGGPASGPLDRLLAGRSDDDAPGEQRACSPSPKPFAEKNRDARSEDHYGRDEGRSRPKDLQASAAPPMPKST